MYSITGFLDSPRMRTFVLCLLTLVVLLGGSGKQSFAKSPSHSGSRGHWRSKSSLMNARSSVSDSHPSRTRKMGGTEKRQMADFFEGLVNSASSHNSKEQQEKLKLIRLIKDEIYQDTDEYGRTQVQREIEEQDKQEIPPQYPDVAEGNGSDAHCVYTQDPGEQPRIVNASDPAYYPQRRYMKSRLPAACTMFHNTSTCCNGHQADLLMQRTGAIQMFANPALLGCQACADNLVRFWCIVTCSPFQSEFLLNASMRETSEYGPIITGTLLGFKDYLCELWDSCKDTGTVGLLSLPSSEALYKLQLQTHGPANGVYFYLDYADEDPVKHRVNAPIQSCNNYMNLTHPEKKNMSCPCESCGASCTKDAEPTYSPVAVLYGFNKWPVIGLYIFIALVTAISIWKDGLCDRNK
eukprot:gb/GECG01007515.1/.p1 GENE.gb/GECG01007515.1/~~gb/GECG01007515.1/.p1  ORF type:complete len:409 (+),score=30.44 gb/GECG01007515.1/:1-1227(+)